MLQKLYIYKAKLTFLYANTWRSIYFYCFGVLCSLIATFLATKELVNWGIGVGVVGLIFVILFNSYKDTKYAKVTKYWHDIIRHKVVDMGDMTLEDMAKTETEFGKEIVCVQTSTLIVESKEKNGVFPMVASIANNLVQHAFYYYLIPPELDGQFSEFRTRIRNFLRDKYPTGDEVVRQALSHLVCRYTASCASPFDGVTYFKNKSVHAVYIYLNKDPGAMVLKVDPAANDKMGSALDLLIGKRLRG